MESAGEMSSPAASDSAGRSAYHSRRIMAFLREQQIAQRICQQRCENCCWIAVTITFCASSGDLRRQAESIKAAVR
ncbi:hypothetical protein KCP70_13615 [Salmonella enterica subsp. enterica]|nr:hypothetical protein KCP70_13615 [Salmonella enterica subsp. enterica]